MDQVTTILRKHRSGFTLIEVLAVVVILGLISAVIVPQIATRDDQRAAAAARTVMSDLLYVQNRAVSQQKVHYVQFSTAGQTYKVLDIYSPARTIKNPVDGSTFLVTFGNSSTSGLKDMQLQSASFDGASTLAFDALGVPQSVNVSTGALTPLVNGSVIVKSGSFKLTVMISPFSGELTVQ